MSDFREFSPNKKTFMAKGHMLIHPRVCSCSFHYQSEDILGGRLFMGLN